MLAALSSFRSELVESADGYEVVVGLPRGDGEVVAVLNALEQYVTERGSSAQVEVDGHMYVMHPAPENDPG
jgi:hypothetical protein